MKQVVQNYRTGELKVADVPAPRTGAGNLLISTRVSLISSGTEKQLVDLAKASLVKKAVSRPDLVRDVLRKVQRDGIKPTLEKVFAKLDTPIPLGYSLAGEVIEIGRKVPSFAVGDRVVCAGAGFANHAEINSVPKNLCVRIPEGVTDTDASFATLGAIAMQGVRVAAPTLGERVVVMGLGLIGLITVQLLKANGCRVLGFDPNELRVALARDLGADLAVASDLPASVLAFTNGCGADAVLLTASSKSSEPLNTAAEISRLKGRIVVVGMVGMAINREPFYKRELELKLSMSYGPGRHDPSYELEGNDYPLAYVRWTEQRNLEAFLELVAGGKVTPSQLVTHRFPIADAEQAYELMEKGPPHLAILLTYSDAPSAPIVRELRKDSHVNRTSGGVHIGFIGLGSYAKSMLLPALRKANDVRLTRVCTSTGLSASHAGDKQGFATVATDPRAVIEADDTDIIFVATRHDTHAELAAASLHAGKHVFCEKPLALSAGELDAVVAAAEASSAVLTVGFNRRFAPLLLKAKAALEPRTSPLVMLYRINAGTISDASWIQRDEGGGRIVGEVCHFVDALTFLCGALPLEVSAIAARNYYDAVSILIRFGDGSTGTIVYSSLGDVAVAKESIEVFAAGRVVQLDDFRSITVTAGGKSKSVKAPQDKGQAALVAAFLQAARGKAAPPIALRELFAVTEATFATEQALRTGMPVTIPQLEVVP